MTMLEPSYRGREICLHILGHKRSLVQEDHAQIEVDTQEDIHAEGYMCVPTNFLDHLL